MFIYILKCLIQSPKAAWDVFGQPLMIVQSTMAFEIFHAMFGLVRSPVFVTTLQVMSRLWVIYGATFYAKSSQVSVRPWMSCTDSN